jgi:hypothetical protein
MFLVETIATAQIKSTSFDSFLVKIITMHLLHLQINQLLQTISAKTCFSDGYLQLD